jgi:hypothetical protein
LNTSKIKSKNNNQNIDAKVNVKNIIFEENNFKNKINSLNKKIYNHTKYTKIENVKNTTKKFIINLNINDSNDSMVVNDENENNINRNNNKKNNTNNNEKILNFELKLNKQILNLTTNNKKTKKMRSSSAPPTLKTHSIFFPKNAEIQKKLKNFSSKSFSSFQEKNKNLKNAEKDYYNNFNFVNKEESNYINKRNNNIIIYNKKYNDATNSVNYTNKLQIKKPWIPT